MCELRHLKYISTEIHLPFSCSVVTVTRSFCNSSQLALIFFGLLFTHFPELFMDMLNNIHPRIPEDFFWALWTLFFLNNFSQDRYQTYWYFSYSLRRIPGETGVMPHSCLWIRKHLWVKVTRYYNFSSSSF